MWGEFRRVLAKNRGQARRPARSEQNPAKKFSFPFRRKNRVRAKSETQRKLFCWVASGSERRRVGFLGLVSVRNFGIVKTHQINFVGNDCSARRVRRAPQGKIRFCFRREIPEFASIVEMAYNYINRRFDHFCRGNTEILLLKENINTGIKKNNFL